MTPKQEAALRQAREALVVLDQVVLGTRRAEEAITAIDEALAEPEEKYQYGTPLLDAMTGKTEQPAHVAAVNTSSERVDKTAKNVHEQPAQQEPVAWIEHGSDEVPSVVVWERGSSGHYTPLYTSPPASKPWVGLTEEEVDECYYWKGRQWTTDELVRHVEAKLREKNNG